MFNPFICLLVTPQQRFNETATDSEKAWLEQKQAAATPAKLAAFVAVPRFITRRPLPGRPDWTTDQLARVLLLTSLPTDDETVYVKAIETLFDTAEMQELAALYTALPYLMFPQRWLARASEAVRSNMGPVFDAFAFNNSYPADYFSEAAWNQLVLKCIFNDKPISRIIGLDCRANQTLANNLSDFAHERWAAGRSVPAEVWQLIPKFMNETLLSDVKRLADSPDERDRQAARQVCEATDYEPAKRLLHKL